MAFDMYGDVILTRDVGERGLRAGDVGTIVERHVAQAPGLRKTASAGRPRLRRGRHVAETGLMLLSIVGVDALFEAWAIISSW